MGGWVVVSAIFNLTFVVNLDSLNFSINCNFKFLIINFLSFCSPALLNTIQDLPNF